MRRGASNSRVTDLMENSNYELSRAMVDGQTAQNPAWQIVAALQSYAKFLFDFCFGQRVRVNARELKLKRQIAEGGFSFVWRAVDVHTGEEFAIKQVLCQTAEQRAAIRREVDVHLGLSHPNVARLVDYAFQRISDDGTERASLVLPLWSQGSLQDRILAQLPRGPYFAEATALHIFAGLCQGVQASGFRCVMLGQRDESEPPIETCAVTLNYFRRFTATTPRGATGTSALAT